MLPQPEMYGTWQEWARAALLALGSGDADVVAGGAGSGGVSYTPAGYVPLWIQDPGGTFYIGNDVGAPPTAPDIVFVDTANIADAAIAANKILAGAVDSTHLADLAVVTAKIADAAIVTAKIGDLQVVTAKIADLAVNNAKIANLAVDSAKIDNLAVNNAKIGLLAVGQANIIDASINSAKIANASILTADIGNAQITTALIGSAQITNALVANASIGTAQIIDASISSAKIISVLAAQIVAANLSAITATIGVLRTATSGARMEIRDNVIKVYDSGGVVRVQIGDLTL